LLLTGFLALIGAPSVFFIAIVATVLLRDVPSDINLLPIGQEDSDGVSSQIKKSTTIEWGKVYQGFSGAQAGGLWALVGGLSTLCGLIWGGISDKIGRAKKWMSSGISRCALQ